MWKRGGRSSALDRAQALLSAKRSSTGGGESVQGSAAKTRAHTGAVETRSAPPNAHTAFSDLSDLSSVSSAPEHGAHTVGSAAAGETQGRELDLTKDLGPRSPLGGGGSRFLKKAPPPATRSSQSPVSKSQLQQEPEPRYAPSSQRGSQAAALSRLAQIESRVHSRQQARRGPKPAENLTSGLGLSPPTPPPAAAAQSPEASAQLSAQSGSDRSPKGKRFLKSNIAGAVNNTNSAAAAAGSPKGPDAGGGPRSRAADPAIPQAGLETKSARAVRGVSLESDEEDMRKLLGDSLDSMDNSFLVPGRPSSQRAPPRPPSSPSRRASPFRFTGQAQARFSPSVLSPPPSPRRSPSSSSSMSGRSEVLSLAELFPVGPGSEDAHSEMSAVSSEDFKINVMTLDDLVPAALGFPGQTPGKEREAKHSSPVPGSLNRRQQLRLKEKEEEQPEGVLDYHSDFESEGGTEPGYSASQVSEHVQRDGDEEEVVSEVREEASDSDASRGRTEGDYSSAFSDASRSDTSRTSDRSQTPSRSWESRSSVSRGSRTSSRQSRRRASTREGLKEAAVQTQPDPLAHTWPAGMAAFGPAAGLTYMEPTPVVAHTLSAETVEALSTFNPAVFALREMLKQQLAMTRRFIESSRHLHSSLVQSLEPPDYRYTTLEDTKEYIRKHRPPKLTMEEALQEVLQEMR